MAPVDTLSLSTSSTSTSSSNMCNMEHNLNSINSDARELYQNLSENDLVPLPNDELDLLIKLERANKYELFLILNFKFR